MALSSTPKISAALATGRDSLHHAWSDERALANAARRRNDTPNERLHLERAHILSQPLAGPHVRTHIAMLGFAVRRRDRHEVLGQMLRVLLAAPGTWSGRYPTGNTGGADVSALLIMDIPDDLRAILDEHKALRKAS
jgi:hypothetical protein